MNNIEKLNKPDKHIVHLLKSAMEEAEKGHIISVAIAYTYNDGYTTSGFSAPDRVMALLGELTVLERDIMEICIASRKDDAGM